jgi:hypothetical protein
LADLAAAPAPVVPGHSPPRSHNPAATLWGWVFALTLPLTLLAAEAARVIRDPLSLAPALTRQVHEGSLLPVGLAWLSQPTTAGEPNPRLRSLAPGRSALLDLAGALDEEDWRRVLAELMPPDLPGTWIGDTLAAIPGWMAGGPAIPEVYYELRGLKARALSTHGLQALRMALDALPACDPASVQRWAADDQAAPSLPTGAACSLPGSQLEQQFTAYSSQWPESVRSLRQGFTLAEAVNPTGSVETESYFLAARWWLRRVQVAGLLAPVFSVVLLLGILLSIVHSWEDLAIAWAPWLAIGGLLTAALAIASGQPLQQALLESVLARAGAPELTVAAIQVSRPVIGALSGPLLVRGLTSVVLALALLWYRRSVRRSSLRVESVPAAASTRA